MIQTRNRIANILASAAALARCLAFVALLIQGAAGPASALSGAAAAPVLDADAIFRRARDVWSVQSYPSPLDYVITVRVRERGVEKYNHYAAEFRADRNRLRVAFFSDEEAAHPHVPHGINAYISLTLANGGAVPDPQTGLVVKLSRDEAPTDYLGIPYLNPTYSFLLSRPVVVREETDGAPSDPKTIGRVSAENKQYDVSLLGIEKIDGSSVYRLALKPIARPHVYRIRELWIDASDFSTRKMVTDGNFSANRFSGVPWTTTFQRKNGALYIDTESANEPVRMRGRLYEQASISFQSFEQPKPTERERFLLWLGPPADALTEPPDERAGRPAS